jgi:hypothetical protein
MTPQDIKAADYVTGLWGSSRRAFALRYWLYLTDGTTKPLFTMCFGAAYIAKRLEFIYGFCKLCGARHETAGHYLSQQ